MLNNQMIHGTYMWLQHQDWWLRGNNRSKAGLNTGQRTIGGEEKYVL
jgi:hypothetical protein